MPKTAGLRDPAAAFPLPTARDDVQERRETNRAIAVSAAGLAATGIIELLSADVRTRAVWQAARRRAQGHWILSGRSP
jgi:hypothetical protein